MNIKEIKEMVTLMNENGLVELEIEKDGMRIRLKKTTGGTIEAFSGPIAVAMEKRRSWQPRHRRLLLSPRKPRQRRSRSSRLWSGRSIARLPLSQRPTWKPDRLSNQARSSASSKQ